MKKKLIAIAAAALMVVALAGCSSSSSSSSASASASGSASASASASGATGLGTGASLNFVTGGETGTYYAVGGAIAQDVTNNQNVKVTALSSGGSKANIMQIQDKEAQLGFAQSDVLSYAYEGTNIFADEGAIKDFSSVGVLYDEVVQIVTCDPEIKTVADLKGKRVSIGAAGSGVYFNAIDILGAYGISESDITPQYQSFGDSADALQNGQIDAAFIVAGAPTTAITQLSTNKQAYLVSLDEEHVSKLIAASPFYSKSVIKGGTYTGVDADTTTVAVQAVVIADNAVAADDIYAFTADLFNNLETLKAANAKFGEMSIEKGASFKGVPYHAGAAKYFSEQGQKVA